MLTVGLIIQNTPQTLFFVVYGEREVIREFDEMVPMTGTDAGITPDLPPGTGR